jgi:hypothetical protein
MAPTLNPVYRAGQAAVIRAADAQTGTSQYVLEQFTLLADRIADLSRTLRRVVPPEATAASTHHLRVNGDAMKLEEYIAQLRDGSLGVRPHQYQRYSAVSAAVNIATRDQSVLEALSAAAGKLGLRLDILEIG